MCIYYEDQQNLTYRSEEHIFPATIGGIKTLPKGWVSDKANDYFSKLESQIVTESFIGLEKMFYGPGKRGTKKPGRMPITLFLSIDKENLGFSFEGKPHYIPQIVISKDLRRFSISRDDLLQTNNDIEKLINKIKKFDGKYTLISNKPELSAFLIGLYEKRIFISINDKNKIPKFIEYINKHIADKINYSEATKSKVEKPQIILNMSIDTVNNARVFAKVALNVIASLRGNNYLKNPHFEEIKQWILGKDNDNYKQLPRDVKFLKNLINDDNRLHYCIVMNINNSLVAIIAFYNHWTMTFEICKSFDDFFNSPFVYFCDWQNKKEYTLYDYLHLLYLEEETL